MKAIRFEILFVRALVAGFVFVTLSLPVWATPARRGKLHVTKDCSASTGEPGSFCTITSSNLPEIAVGSKVFYFQAAISSTGLLDSNIVLDAGNANRAIGRCTLELATNLALCTFSDGTGTFAGFHARINGSGSDTNYHWDGTYHFTRHGNK